MHLLYVDESGDPGAYNGHNSPHYILTGIIVAQNDWSSILQKLKNFKSRCKDEYGLPIGIEIHAAELIRINKQQVYKQIKKRKRILMLQEFCQQIPVIFAQCKVINICIDKENHSDQADYEELAWKRLIQRFDTYLKKSAKDLGMIVSDDTNEPMVRKLVRMMRVYNPVPARYPTKDGKSYRQVPVDNIIEDPVMRSSDKSYFIQAADAIAHCLYRKEYPKGSLKKYRIELFFDNIIPILLKAAATYDKNGIVRK